jgi:phage shock protein A
MGALERAKHLAREIAEENLRRLSGAGLTNPPEDAAVRRRILELEDFRRELLLHRKEVEASEKLARERHEQLLRKVDEWRNNAAFALARDNDELSFAAEERAAGFEREADVARAESAVIAATIARLGAELEELDRRIEAERARPGSRPSARAVAATSLRPARSRRRRAPRRARSRGSCRRATRSNRLSTT